MEEAWKVKGCSQEDMRGDLCLYFCCSFSRFLLWVCRGCIACLLTTFRELEACREKKSVFRHHARSSLARWDIGKHETYE